MSSCLYATPPKGVDGTGPARYHRRKGARTTTKAQTRLPVPGIVDELTVASLPSLYCRKGWVG